MNPSLLFKAAICVLLASDHAWAQVEPGQHAPDYLGMTTEGQPFKLSEHKGKVVVATFWASWCAPCRAELPLLEGMQKTLGQDQVKVVAISIEDGEMFRQIRRFSRNMSLQFVHDYNGSVSTSFGRKAVPHLVVIGKDGVLKQRFIGYSEEQAEDIVNQVQKAIQER